MSFKIKHCRINISYYFFVMAASLLLMCHDRLFFCGIAAAAVHELGHIIAIVCCRGCFIRCIDIAAFGIRMTANGATDRPIIILAGVIANTALLLICTPLLLLGNMRNIAMQLISANLCLALCNILPIEPMDGGTLLRRIAERRLSPDLADRAVFIISVFSLFPLTVCGLFAVMQSRGNFSLLILCLWLLAGILKRYI